MYINHITSCTQNHWPCINTTLSIALKTLKNVSNVDNTLKFITPLFSQLHQPIKHSLRRIRLCVCVCVCVCVWAGSACLSHWITLAVCHQNQFFLYYQTVNMLWSPFPKPLTPNPAKKFPTALAEYLWYAIYNVSPEFQMIHAARIYETVFIVHQFRLSAEPRLSVWQSQSDGHYY